MKVEFMTGPSSYVNVSSFGSRVLTESLMRDDRIDATFNMTTVLNEVRAESYLRDAVSKQIENLRPDLSKVYSIGLRTAASVYAAYKYYDSVPESVKCDTVLYSSNNGVFDFPTLNSLLNSGIRVVIGGPSTIIDGPQKIREQLLEYGCKHMDDLIVVSGFVDMSTDLFKIINDWKDVVIDQNDFTTLWDCERDFVQPYLKILKRIASRFSYKIATIFESGCWWKKCTFCSYNKIPHYSYVDGCSVEKISDNLIKTCNLHETNRVFVGDDYFLFNDFNEAVFEILNANNIKIEIYSGIHMLKNIEYVQKINKYIDSMALGVESCDDFSLKYINKGYTYEDIKTAFNNVSKYCSGLKIDMMLMMDLPVRSSDDVIQNYTRVKQEKEKLTCNGIEVSMMPKLLEVNWSLRETLLDNNYIRISKPDSKTPSGRYVIWKTLEELGIVDSEMYVNRTTPLERYDESGNVLESDLFIISDELFKGLTNES